MVEPVMLRPVLVQGPELGGGCSLPGVDQRRMVTGLDSWIMLLSTWTARAASACWPASVRARSLGPIWCLYLPIAFSARLGQKAQRRKTAR